MGIEDDLRNRYRRDYTREPIKSAVTPPLTAQAPPPQTQHPVLEERQNPPVGKGGIKRSTKSKKRIVLLFSILILIGLLTATIWQQLKASRSPIPTKIQQSISFPIYYPDIKKLPKGYTLNPDSFKSPDKNVVVYSLTAAGNKRLVFSEQEKPSADDLANFNKKYLPIHRQVLTQTGTATEGSINTQTVVSLPADTDNTWILVTAPSNMYGSSELAQILKSIKK